VPDASCEARASSQDALQPGVVSHYRAVGLLEQARDAGSN